MIPHPTINEMGEVVYEFYELEPMTLFNYWNYPLNSYSYPPFEWLFYDWIWHNVGTIIGALVIFMFAQLVIIWLLRFSFEKYLN